MSEFSANQYVDPYEIFKRESANGLIEYSAGFPGYPENFTRDGATAGIVGGNADLLSAQLKVSAFYQGVKNDPDTGEQIGRNHHQVPGAKLKDRDGLTTYNACDTTPLFLIGAEGLSHLDPETFNSFIENSSANLEAAVDHIVSMTGETDNLFWEKPPEGADGFNLRVTMWKDSSLPHADGKEEPKYPVTFAQAHFVAARSLLSASRILQRPELAEKSDLMFRAGINEFIRPDGFVVYKDSEVELMQDSSDELHLLAYIPEDYAELLPLNAIRHRAKGLATPFGYLCTPPSVSEHLEDKYHADSVWIIDQALIHYGATKFDLAEVADTAASVAECIDEGQELVGIKQNEDGSMSPVPRGFPRMLWSIAAAEYFAGRSMLSHEGWL